MEVIYKDSIFTINDKRVEFVKNSYKSFIKQYTTHDIKKIQLRYVINSHNCKTYILVEIVTAYFTVYYKNINNRAYIHELFNENDIFIDITHEINPKFYNYIYTDINYIIPWTGGYKTIDAKSKTGNQIKEIYENIIKNKSKDMDFIKYHYIQIYFIDDVVIKVVDGKNNVEYFDEKNNSTTIPESIKGITKFFMLEKFPYRYLNV